MGQFSFGTCRLERAQLTVDSGGADPAASRVVRVGWVYDIKADSNSCKRA
jgi:hypothetical protein